MPINQTVTHPGRRTRRLAGLAVLMLLLPAASRAMVRGEAIPGPTAVFDLTAREGTVGLNPVYPAQGRKP